MTEPLVSARSVTKSYELGKRSLNVLRELTFAVPRGEFIALRGASGAGKSTLLHLLGGLDSPDKGEVWFDGQNLANYPASDLAHLRNSKIGFVFQAYHLLPELDALENVCLPARIARMPVDQAEARGRELLSRVGLKERMDHRPAELSGGERQRVAIARALAPVPDLLLVDEPTSRLDLANAEAVAQLLGEATQLYGATIVCATHEPVLVDHAHRELPLGAPLSSAA
jgi:ABC-type lipoprotein export system ATPase subunit